MTKLVCFKYILQMEQQFFKYGYYIWCPAIVKQFYCFFSTESENTFDYFSVALLKDKTVCIVKRVSWFESSLLLRIQNKHTYKQ
jgi:hypothetical protein